MTSSAASLEPTPLVREEISPPAVRARRSRRVAPPDRAVQIVVLVGTSAMVALAFWLRLDDDGTVILPIWNISLPGLCWWQRTLGLACPGCGLTRSVVATAHGDFAAAWGYNPIGIGVLCMAVLEIPFRLVQLRRAARRAAELWHPGASLIFGVAGILLLVQWLWRLPKPW